jgi:hypothetical protein
MKSSIFWDLTPCSPLKVNIGFGETCRLHLQNRRISRSGKGRESKWQTELLPPTFTLVSHSAYSSILKTEATCSSETSLDFQRTTRRFIPEDRTLLGDTVRGRTTKLTPSYRQDAKTSLRRGRKWVLKCSLSLSAKREAA